MKRSERAYLRYILWSISASVGCLVAGAGIAMEATKAIVVAGGVIFAISLAMMARSGWHYLRIRDHDWR